MISSNVFERWLISITDMPTPGSDSISSRACSRTGTGITAGPALKLKILSVISSSQVSEYQLQLGLIEAEIPVYSRYSERPLSDFDGQARGDFIARMHRLGFARD